MKGPLGRHNVWYLKVWCEKWQMSAKFTSAHYVVFWILVCFHMSFVHGNLFWLSCWYYFMPECKFSGCNFTNFLQAVILPGLHWWIWLSGYTHLRPGDPKDDTQYVTYDSGIHGTLITQELKIWWEIFIWRKNLLYCINFGQHGLHL